MERIHSAVRTNACAGAGVLMQPSAAGFFVIRSGER
jgi:hypothetical protein